MKIETFKISVACKDEVVRGDLAATMTGLAERLADTTYVYGVEVDGSAESKAHPEANEEPRKKRKYTRRPKAPQNAEEGAETAARGGIKVRRIRSEGGVVEMRGNCQGGYAKAEGN